MKGDKDDIQQLTNRYFREGTDRLASRLFNRCYLMVVGVCYSFLNDRESSRSTALQVFEVFLKTARSAPIQNPEGWLYVAAKNASLKWLRDQKKLRNYHADPFNEPAIWIEDPESPDPFVDHLEPAMNDLNEEQRESITLFYLRGLSYQQISESKGWSLMQVKSFIQNGKRNLKKLLLQYGRSKTG